MSPERYTPLTQAILAVVKGIPAGTVRSYGQVAALAGNPRAARQVVRVLSSMGESQGLPWHRVISSAGRISLPGEWGALQEALLASEGVYPDGKGRYALGTKAER